MSCFPCFSTQVGKKPTKRKNSRREQPPPSNAQPENQRRRNIETAYGKDTAGNGANNITAQTFTFRDLANATNNFRPDCLVGEGGFGRVYRGQLLTGKIVAVKQLDRNGSQGNKEFLVEVMMLSHLHHQNLVKLIGYCADGDQRLLVYEYMSLGSLEDHLFDIRSDRKPLDWYSRMKIALGAAMGLEYLHDKANPSVIYRDFKSSNILLEKNFHSKLSDFELAKLGPIGDIGHVSTRVMGTYGYCAPEYQRTGQLTPKSDVYSFGVVLLELITGRRAVDSKRPKHEQYLVAWAQPLFRDPSRYPEIADPLLGGDFPVKGLNQAVAVVSMCLQEEETARPLIRDVVAALTFLTITPKDGDTSPLLSEPSPTSDYTVGSSSSHGEESAEEHQRAMAEALQWGSNHSAISHAQSY